MRTHCARTHCAAAPAILLCLALGSTHAIVTAVDAGPASDDALQVERTADVPYLVDPTGMTHTLSVYAPTAPGPWPTAVMIHGGGGGVGAPLLKGWAQAVAAEGAVVFVPYHFGSPTWSTAADAMAEAAATSAQLACAVRFARSEAGRYGGDPGDLSLFGHSAGANYAALIALADPAVSPDCMAEADSAVPDELMLFEGDWLLLGLPVYDLLLAEDHAVWDALTPWSHAVDAPRIPVSILDSGDPGLVIPAQERIDQLLALRDPDGVYRGGLDRAAALEDGKLAETESQHLLADELASLGYAVSFIDLPGSAHEHLSEAALAMVTDALSSGSMEPSDP